MIWVIPIAGKGTRTRSLGEFKPFIEIKGHKMLMWVLFSIKDKVLPQDTFIFTTTDYFRNKYNLESEIQNIFSALKLNNQFEVFSSPKTLQGSSCSVYLAKEKLMSNEPVIVVNCDQYVDFEFPEKISPKTGYIVLFADFGHKCGYARIENGKISDFVEKNNNSNLASTGIFIISEAKSLTGTPYTGPESA
jgi:NDP-sugar pyrophosphorylase family protein